MQKGYGSSQSKSVRDSSKTSQFFKPGVVKRVNPKPTVNVPPQQPVKEVRIQVADEKKDETIFDKFQQGDLVFGLANPRDAVVKKLHEKQFSYVYANALNDGVVNLVLNDASEEALNTLKAEQLAHFMFLKSHREYLLKSPGKTIPALIDEPKLGAAFRRACKLLLVDRSQKRNRHVLVADIDWEIVCDKTKKPLGVTCSEMRAIYRDIMRNGPNPNVFFYDKNYKLLAILPWEDYRYKHFWEFYALQRMEKFTKPSAAPAAAAARRR